jgi:Icc protein
MKKVTRRGFIKSALALGILPLGLSANETTKHETLREADEESLKLIHITDSHMDLADEESVEALEMMVELVNKEYKDLDFVLFGGDNFNNNVTGDKDALEFKKIISKLHCPSLLVRGNKESNPNPKDSIDLDGFKKLFLDEKLVEVEGKDWVIEKKGYTILGLDSCIENANNGKYTEETIKFAEKVLKKGNPTVLMNHHPYTNYWKEKDEKLIHKYVLNNTKEVQKRLFSYDNLLLTLSGHKHIDSVTNINKTSVIVTRGFIKPLDLDQYPMRYIELKGNKISEKLIYTA